MMLIDKLKELVRISHTEEYWNYDDYEPAIKEAIERIEQFDEFEENDDEKIAELSAEINCLQNPEDYPDYPNDTYWEQVATIEELKEEQKSLVSDLESHMEIASGYINGTEFKDIVQENSKLKDTIERYRTALEGIALTVRRSARALSITAREVLKEDT